MKTQKPETQFDRFIETARALGCDEDKGRFEKQLGEIAAHKTAKGPPRAPKERKTKKPAK